jgi:hypothetical protein
MAISIFPTVETSGAGAGYNWEPIADVSTSGVSSISFTAIDPKYKSLRLIWNLGSYATNERSGIRLNNFSTSDYAVVGDRLTSSTWAARAGITENRIDYFSSGASNTDGENGDYIFDLCNIAAFTTFRGVAVKGQVRSVIHGGLLKNTAVINQIDMLTFGGNFGTGTVYLLGSE